MYHRQNFRRAAVTAVAVGSLLSLASCGSDPQPADPSGSGSSATGDDTTDEGTKTIVFSPLSLQIPFMKGVADGMQAMGPDMGFDVTVQDPGLDPQKQATDLQAVVESGKADVLWAIAIAPQALAQVVQSAQEKGVVVLVNGTPEDYGFDGETPGITFETIQYAEQGAALGEELGNCINEKLDGEAEIVWVDPAPGTAGADDLIGAAEEALKATAPNAKVVSHVTVGDRGKTQTDIASSLQGNPDANAVMGLNDEGALGALGAFAGAGKDLPCLTEAGGNEEVLAAVEDGKIYASVALQFEEALANDFEYVQKMVDDPSKGYIISVPQKVIKAEG